MSSIMRWRRGLIAAIGVTSCLRAGLQHPISSQAGGTSGDLAKHAAAAASFNHAFSNTLLVQSNPHKR